MQERIKAVTELACKAHTIKNTNLMVEALNKLSNVWEELLSMERATEQTIVEYSVIPFLVSGAFPPWLFLSQSGKEYPTRASIQILQEIIQEEVNALLGYTDYYLYEFDPPTGNIKGEVKYVEVIAPLPTVILTNTRNEFITVPVTTLETDISKETTVTTSTGETITVPPPTHSIVTTSEGLKVAVINTTLQQSKTIKWVMLAGGGLLLLNLVIGKNKNKTR